MKVREGGKWQERQLCQRPILFVTAYRAMLLLLLLPGMPSAAWQARRYRQASRIVAASVLAIRLEEKEEEVW